MDKTPSENLEALRALIDAQAGAFYLRVELMPGCTLEVRRDGPRPIASVALATKPGDAASSALAKNP